MSDKAALQGADDPARFPASLTNIDHAKLIPYLLVADSAPVEGSLPAPEKPTPSAIEYFIQNRPQKNMSLTDLNEMAKSHDTYIKPTAQYLSDHFQAVSVLGNDGTDQTNLSDNDLSILATLLKVDTSLREAEIAAHALKVHFKEIDKNGNGNLTLEEVGDYAKANSPDFQSVYAATSAQFKTLAHADADDSGISWTDAANVANGDAVSYYMHDAYYKHQVHAQTWWVPWTAGAIGAGVGYLATRNGTWGQQAGTALGASLGSALIADEVAGSVAGDRIEKYYESTAVLGVNALFARQ